MSPYSDEIDLLLRSFDRVVRSALPEHIIHPYIPPPPKGRLIVIGAGKASAAMASAFETGYDGDIEGIVITRYGHSRPTRSIQVIEAAHPVPDENCVAGVHAIFKLLQTATADDLVVCLISGGGSSLLSCPVDGVELHDIQNIGRALLKSGAPIQEVNIVRKHLNKALGGGLASIAPETQMITLAISDVVGDNTSSIASGASVADPSTLAQAIDILHDYKINAPPSVINALENEENETLKPDHPAFKNNEYHLIATPGKSLNQLCTFWQTQGIAPYILDSEIEGDTNLCAQKHIEFLQPIVKTNVPVSPPCVVLSGGETTVTISGDGDGGPNTQFMLQSALALNGNQRIYGMACDTDGIDGSRDNAGAFITPYTLQLAQNAGLNAQEYLRNNDSYHFFENIDALVKTGPTYTNINDYRAFLILP